MSSPFIASSKRRPAARPPRTGGPKSIFPHINPVTAMLQRLERQRREAEAAAAAAATASAATTTTTTPATTTIVAARTVANSGSSHRRAKCPNKHCPEPNVVEGTCRTCGRVADDSNIVAEVQFDEASNGAAVVQGSFLAADQAGPRRLGPAGRRLGSSSEQRDKSIREAKMLMMGYAQQLSLPESAVAAASQAFMLGFDVGFTRGRTLPAVAAVCLYIACRIEPPCKIMLIDMADLVQVNVFKLGRTFKRFNEAVPICNEHLPPVTPEDLIWRFATKLEFGDKTSAVAEAAVRLIRRMGRDWITMGRRPSGICGACLLMAARMFNFRRTVREVVYIVKVTTHTIQHRLTEFCETESSGMTVDDFLSKDLQSSHDPPSFYRQQEAWKRRKEEEQAQRAKNSKKKRRDKKKGKKKAGSAGAGTGTGHDASSGADDDSDSDHQIAPASRDPESTSAAAAKHEETPQPTGPDLSAFRPLEFRRDAEGFIIPPLPSQIEEIKEKEREGLLDPALLDPALLDPALLMFDQDGEGGEGEGGAGRSGGRAASALNSLARQHGDQPAAGDADYEEGEDENGDGDGDGDKGEEYEYDEYGEGGAGPEEGQGRNRSGSETPVRSQRASQRLPVDADWEEDERDLEGVIDEMFNDPETWQHALAYANAEQRARIHATWALQQEHSQNPDRHVPTAEEVAEEEFADDPEIIHCLLTPEETRIKEILWVNENKDWLRKQQEKVWQQKLDADKPPKPERKRKRNPPIGEGQTEPANSPAEAAVNALKKRAWSKRINYDAIRELFDDGDAEPAASPPAGADHANEEDHDDEDHGEASAGQVKRATPAAAGPSGAEAPAEEMEQDVADYQPPDRGYNGDEDEEDEYDNPIGDYGTGGGEFEGPADFDDDHGYGYDDD